MSEPIFWSEDGTPTSPRFTDIYRSATGGLEQARHVFLAGCDLPSAWSGHERFTVLETGFGLGVNFLATWLCWQMDAQRPRMLHFASVEAWPVSAADILRSALPWPELQPLARQLAQAWWGLVPGIHRLSFADGRVLLTLAIGDVQPMLRALDCDADAVFLDGFSPTCNPRMWDNDTLKAISRHCHTGTLLATWSTTPALRESLQQLGFTVHRRRGLPPKRRALSARYAPAWTLKRTRSTARLPTRALVVGAGLSGAAVAASLARRGWQVQVLDAADQPAQGASALPVGLMVPHVSPDDAYVSRASRAGVRATLETVQLLLQAEVDWQLSGSLRRPSQRPGARLPRLPTNWDESLDGWAALWGRNHAQGIWHDKAAWIRPAALVRAWLSQDGIVWRCNQPVHSLAYAADSGLWSVLDASGQALADAPMVVVCAAAASQALVAPWFSLRVDQVTGQVAWGDWPAGISGPATPTSGQGHLIPAAVHDTRRIWLSGSTYERTPLQDLDRAAGIAANLQRIRDWAPELELILQQPSQRQRINSWKGERCTTHDRLPLVGALGTGPLHGLQICTGMGSRGLTFAALCAELLTAKLHGEPLPLERRLAKAFDAARQVSTKGAAQA